MSFAFIDLIQGDMTSLENVNLARSELAVALDISLDTMEPFATAFTQALSDISGNPGSMRLLIDSRAGYLS